MPSISLLQLFHKVDVNGVEWMFYLSYTMENQQNKQK